MKKQKVRQKVKVYGLVGLMVLFVGLAVTYRDSLGEAMYALVDRNGNEEMGIEKDLVPGHYIVVMKDEEDTQVIQSIKDTYQLSPSFTYDKALKGFAATMSAAHVEQLKKDPRVAYVTQDRLVKIASHLSQQTLPTGINRMNAENKANNGKDIHVAVLDTGIDLSHPDLKANIAGGKNCSSGGSYNDGNGHGSHVAGTIAAVDNGTSVVGVAPEAKLWAVRVLNNSGYGSWATLICGIDFVTSKAPQNGGPITVANMSLGGSGTSDNNCGNSNNDPLHKAICRSRDAGVTYVVASGNEGKNAGTLVPAAYNDAVITVSALADSDGNLGGTGASTSYGTDDTFASFSNWGNVVDLGAPGVNILSTWKSGGTRILSGTSMATPHVAGAVALYLKSHPGSSWTAVRDALVSLGEKLGNGHTDPSGKHSEPVVRVDTL